MSNVSGSFVIYIVRCCHEKQKSVWCFYKQNRRDASCHSHLEFITDHTHTLLYCNDFWVKMMQCRSVTVNTFQMKSLLYHRQTDWTKPSVTEYLKLWNIMNNGECASYLWTVFDVMAFSETQVTQVVGWWFLTGFLRFRWERQLRDVVRQWDQTLQNVVQRAVRRKPLI